MSLSNPGQSRQTVTADHAVDATSPGICGNYKTETSAHHAVGGMQQIKQNRIQCVTWLDRWVVRKTFEFMGVQAITVTFWNGEVMPSRSKPVVYVRFNDRAALYMLLLDPELHFGELYTSGRLDVDGDLVGLLENVYVGIRGDGGAKSLLHKFLIGIGHRKISNSISKARSNIHHHYDLGNDFYKVWLDTEAMQYTCAYFPRPGMTLEQAQVAKLHHICRKLQLKPGERVVEAGCGWGGLARFMAKHYGVHVKAYNISQQQIKYAREQAEIEGVADEVEFIEDDYRNVTGKFDAFVSIGMLEHVGVRDYATMGEVIKRCVKANGRGLVHSIGRFHPGPMNAWVERRIFPGAYPPSLKETMDIFEPNNLVVQDVENLRLHYSKTLEHWLLRFEQNVEALTNTMDENFVRAWRLYLMGSIAAFNTNELELYQVLFNKVGNNDLPWSREFMYPAQQQDA